MSWYTFICALVSDISVFWQFQIPTKKNSAQGELSGWINNLTSESRVHTNFIYFPLILGGNV